MAKAEQVKWTDFKWDSIHKEHDAISVMWWKDKYKVTVMKGFHLDTNNYTNIEIVGVPQVLIRAVMDEAATTGRPWNP